MAETETETETTHRHPLDPLDATEIREAAAAYRRAAGEDDPLFAQISLQEPTKAELAAFDAGEPIPRRAFVVAVPGPAAEVVEAVVVLGGPDGPTTVESRRTVAGARPYLLFEEIVGAMAALYGHPDFVAAMARRGITDLDRVQMDPWPPGTFGLAVEANRRLSRVVFYDRDFAEDNGYAHPIEGVYAHVDLGSGEVLEVVDLADDDTAVVPVPRPQDNYYPDRVGPLRDDLRPIEITQPEGVSFSVEGNRVRWQRWQFRVGFDPVEGLVLHRVGYEDPARGGGVRSILHRASLAEMVVPYGSTDPAQRWKNAFDAGEWGMGRFTNSLELGCDCLGVIHYFDAVLATERGDARVITNAICLHEEDYNVLWKHTDLHSGTTEVRRQRRLVISAWHTVGNYEYGFFWYFYLDGSLQLEVKLTGIVQPQGTAPLVRPDEANLVTPEVAAPHHQHLFCMRLDFDVDGTANTVVEVDVEPLPEGSDNPEHNGFRTVPTVLASEQQAQRVIDPTRSRTWRIVNPSVRNRVGQPTAYKLIPGSTPTLLAQASSWVARRAAFATRNLWVTAFDPEELRAAGRYPNQSGGGDGLPAWTAADRPLEDADVVVWHTFGVTHIVRPEDFPVMPVECTGFLLVPYGFFDRNPALDVPPSPKRHCHEG